MKAAEGEERGISMTVSEMTEKILKSYERFYNVTRYEDGCTPFVAQALFRSNNEQYVLIKKAKISQQESNEFVFFAAVQRLDLEQVAQLDAAAWQEGLSLVQPHSSHRNSDITLVIIAQAVTGEAVSRVKRLRHYRSYRMGFQGWSAYRIIVLENSSARLIYNRRGRELKKLYQKIIKAAPNKSSELSKEM